MVTRQIISKVVNSGNYSIIESNQLTRDFFVGFEKEFDFITDHIEKYGNVPDKATFLSNFPDTELVEVTESDEYLLDTIKEEHLFNKAVPILQKAAKMFEQDSNAATEYMLSAMKELEPNYGLGGTDIIAKADIRYKQFIERRENKDKWFLTTGFEELDDLIYGLQRGEELLVIYARTSQGKSWFMEKMCTHIWQIGHNVGYISPEMSAISLGYRFDTLNRHFSNKGLSWGSKDIDEVEYASYIADLQDSQRDGRGTFIVAEPRDFNNQITVSKIRNWVKKFKLDIIAVDGIKYLSDERYRRGDNTTTSLTNISEDLMALSIELCIPVLVVVQANRGGVIEKGSTDTPDLENIRDSDGISHNASKAIALNQKEQGMLVATIKKQRFGAVGGTLMYQWDIDTGNFIFVPSYDDAEPEEKTEEKVSTARQRASQDNDAVF